MNKWFAKYTETFNFEDYENKEELEDNDVVYSYKDDVTNGTFIVDKKYTHVNGTISEDTAFESISTDLSYELIYKCKNNKFLYKLKEKEEIFIFDIVPNNQSNPSNEKIFTNFLETFKVPQTKILPIDVNDNITFIIGQPNTGKSYKFEKSILFPNADENSFKYVKIPVSGGIGNEYKGLQSTDLAITYDPIKKELRFGEFLQILMSAIVNPNVPHVIFLDDFHNQDISSLLSEYTPLFKSQQKRTLKGIEDIHEIFNPSFVSTDAFIDTWNKFIESNCDKDIADKEVPKVPLTNRISGCSLNLVFPSNFYLLGAANFNENTLNIFADWEDRAKITYKNPISTFHSPDNNQPDFLKCCIELNTSLKNILEKNNIFDYEKYCFGLWKIVEADGKVISELDKQKEVIKFLFGMIKNALRFNNKNSWINKIGWKLFIEMQFNEWFKANIKDLNSSFDSEKIDYKTLHDFNIYDDEI